MAKYALNNRLAGSQQVLTTTYKSQALISAATASLRRHSVSEILIGADSAPNASDCPINYDVSRTTANGTATSATAVVADNADAAADAVCVVNHTVEPTVTATSSLWMIALNQRASQRWVAKDGDEFIIPATNLAGVVGRALSPVYVGVVGWQFGFSDR